MPSILFLDDCPKRQAEFLRREVEAVVVDNAADCKLAMAGEGFEEVHLDHDLTEHYENPDSPLSGMEVVRWVCLNQPDVRTFIVHTHNEIAAPLMVAALEAAGYRVVRAPFRFER